MPRQLAPDALPARFILGMIPTVGVLYANAAPLIVSALEQSPQFTPEAAGFIFSANMYGTAIGGLLVIAVVRNLPWRRCCLTLAAIIAMVDGLSIWIDSPTWLATIRFLHGLAGGAIMGFGSLVIARAGHAERTFGIMIAIQMLLGGLIAATLAPLISQFGVFPVWLALVLYTLICICAIPFLDDYPDPHQMENQANSAGNAKNTKIAPWPVIGLAIGTLFLFQAGQMAVYAYVYEIGQQHGLSDQLIGWTNASGIWVGVPAALFAAFWSTRSGYLKPVISGTFLCGASLAGYLYAQPEAYIAASLALGVFFSFVIGYLLATVAGMDESGRMASVGSFVSSLGLASGPFMAAALLGFGLSYSHLIVFGTALVFLCTCLSIRPSRFMQAGGLATLGPPQTPSSQPDLK